MPSSRAPLVAAFATTIRLSWRRLPHIRTTNALHRVVDWLAAIVFVCFVAALFLLILPVGEFGAYVLLGILSAIFGLVLYLALWSRRLPEGLISAMDLETLFQDLHTIDLNTSVLEPMVETVHEVLPPNMPSLEPGAAPTLQTRADPPTLGQVALAAIPGFFGLMGLARTEGGRRSRGLAFLVLGVALGAISSWYLILSARIGELVSGQSMPGWMSLSWLSSMTGTGSSAELIVISLLSAFLVLWVLQLYDAVRHLNTGATPQAHV